MGENLYDFGICDEVFNTAKTYEINYRKFGAYQIMKLIIDNNYI